MARQQYQRYAIIGVERVNAAGIDCLPVSRMMSPASRLQKIREGDHHQPDRFLQ